MNDSELKKLFTRVMRESPIAVLSTINENGFPESRAMLNVNENDIKDVWFTTNTSSRKMAQIKQNNNASVYFVIPEKFEGLLLQGKISVVLDQNIKKKIWKKGWEMYYPGGITDPDYTVLHFTSELAGLYHNLTKKILKL